MISTGNLAAKRGQLLRYINPNLQSTALPLRDDCVQTTAEQHSTRPHDSGKHRNRNRFNEPQHEPSIHDALEAELEAFPRIAQQAHETQVGISNLKHSKYRGSPERDLRCKFH